MKSPSRSDVLFLLAVAALWLPFPGLFAPFGGMGPNSPENWYLNFTGHIFILSLLFYVPAHLTQTALGLDGFSLSYFLLCVAQSSLLTWALFAWRARRAARLRSEGEAAKADP